MPDLYLFDYYIPWWALGVVFVVAVVLCAGVLYWYFRPTFEWAGWRP